VGRNQSGGKGRGGPKVGEKTGGRAWERQGKFQAKIVSYVEILEAGVFKILHNGNPGSAGKRLEAFARNLKSDKAERLRKVGGRETTRSCHEGSRRGGEGLGSRLKLVNFYGGIGSISKN